MKLINYLYLLSCTLGAFTATCGLLMLSIAYPPATSAAYIILGISLLCGLVWWLYDGEISTGLNGLAIVIGVILGIVAKWRGMA